ncbi:MAG: ABC transporter substrate-binding protein [Acutalibacteraceae bacterium]
MKNLKRILSLVLVCLLVLSFTACNRANNAETTTTQAETTTTEPVPASEKVKVAAIKGPTGMGMVDLMDNGRYDFTLTSDPTEVVSLISTGAVDIAACPLNLAANLYKKTGGKIQMLGINTLGVLYVMTNGEEINSLKDLKDKTIYATGQGATPEYIIDYILDKNGLKDSVKVEYLSEHSELMTKLVAGEVKIAVLPEPFVSVATSKNENVKSVISLSDEWKKIDSDTRLAMGCVIARTDFINENPEKVAQFIEDNKLSVENVNTNTYAEMNKMIEKGIVDEAILTVPATVKENKVESEKQLKAAETITRCNIVFMDGDIMKEVANANFEVYFSADPTSVGGEIPSDDIYYAAK